MKANESLPNKIYCETTSIEAQEEIRVPYPILQLLTKKCFHSLVIGEQWCGSRFGSASFGFWKAGSVSALLGKPGPNQHQSDKPDPDLYERDARMRITVTRIRNTAAHPGIVEAHPGAVVGTGGGMPVLQILINFIRIRARTTKPDPDPHQSDPDPHSWSESRSQKRGSRSRFKRIVIRTTEIQGLVFMILHRF
jgi:hypothetical protein